MPPKRLFTPLHVQATRKQPHRRPRLRWAVAAIVLVGLLVWLLAKAPDETPLPHTPGTSSDLPAGPPWIYGQADARFTLTEFADLECPYCQAYFPRLKQWIDTNPDVNWQWHHLPLPMHEPAATREALLAECAGEVGGHAGFWQAVGWIYANTHSEGQGLPPDTHFPEMTPALQGCLDSPRPADIVRRQSEEAKHAGIGATPVLRLLDRQTGKTLVLNGPVEGDGLLSAVDLLSASHGSAESTAVPSPSNLSAPGEPPEPTR
ncbi:thioredoxin domain-containing protein [Xanthomonas arboricola pv. juglandis]|uniref:DsbA family protein n=1 Tax=Xanthomonas arboricola TaxID=56448 RepID=UPI002019D381|nr:thioredoxin domain-containing protein [Xanthomonas arboricola]UQP97333.1 thioredoxin domain-containing protein [Xanthomonas arboricola pv. juglandis]UQQ01548.1 thioredoxin domain-containing protein [Xanthomonas arboricola pv. juglandis]